MKSSVLWGVLALIILAALVGQVVDPEVPHYRWEAIPGFYAGFGFIACILLVILAKGLAKIIEKPEDYYHGG